MTLKEEFWEYITKDNRWLEAFIPITLLTMIYYVQETGQNSVPIDIIAKDFKTYYLQRKRIYREPLEVYRKDNSPAEKLFENLDSEDIKPFIAYVRGNPIKTLSSASVRTKHKFIIKSKNNISFADEIYEAFSKDGWESCVNILQEWIRNHFYKLDNHLDDESQNRFEKRFQRNQAIVKELKAQYQYKCQLCGDSFIEPQITDGIHNYVEVHHISQLAFATDEDEFFQLDKKENCLVVCPHHHKYLHYHQGGGFKLRKLENDKLVLYNGKSTIEVKNNKHILLADVLPLTL